jgi:hypothetical protein
MNPYPSHKYLATVAIAIRCRILAGDLELFQSHITNIVNVCIGMSHKILKARYS